MWSMQSLAHAPPQARDDVVTRHTRFSSRAPLDAIVESIEGAAVASGGRVAREGVGRWVGMGASAGRAGALLLHAPPCHASTCVHGPLRRMRLHIPQPRSGTMQVLVELWEVLPGTHVADLQKVRGNTGGHALHPLPRPTHLTPPPPALLPALHRRPSPLQPSSMPGTKN